LLAFPVLSPLLLFGTSRKWPIRFAVWVAMLGRSLNELPSLVEAHIRSLPSGVASVFLPAAVEQLRAHQSNGDQVVIATGCFEELAQGLLRHAELGHVPLVASTLRPFLGGLVVENHCFGRNKIPMLVARGFLPPWSIAYTDHHADLPVLQLCAERFLISPKPKCLARIEQVLAIEATVLRWRE
jgi:phosphatidylglycerophosphatase C